MSKQTPTINHTQEVAQDMREVQRIWLRDSKAVSRLKLLEDMRSEGKSLKDAWKIGKVKAPWRDRSRTR